MIIFQDNTNIIWPLCLPTPAAYLASSGFWSICFSSRTKNLSTRLTLGGSGSSLFFDTMDSLVFFSVNISKKAVYEVVVVTNRISFLLGLHCRSTQMSSVHEFHNMIQTSVSRISWRCTVTFSFMYWIALKEQGIWGGTKRIKSK